MLMRADTQEQLVKDPKRCSKQSREQRTDKRLMRADTQEQPGERTSAVASAKQNREK
jgi:hypothetical protein